MNGDCCGEGGEVSGSCSDRSVLSAYFTERGLEGTVNVVP